MAAKKRRIFAPQSHLPIYLNIKKTIFQLQSARATITVSIIILCIAALTNLTKLAFMTDNGVGLVVVVWGEEGGELTPLRNTTILPARYHLLPSKSDVCLAGPRDDGGGWGGYCSVGDQ